MQQALRRLSPLLHLTRVTSAFGAVANVWFVVLWTRATEAERLRGPDWVVEGPRLGVLAATAAAAVGLYAFAMALNDTLDFRRDRALHPERPIPSGRLGMEGAVALVALTLLVGLVGAAMIGIVSVRLTLLTAFAILVYHAVARFFPSLGLVALGLIYAAHMLIPNFWLVFVWPVWLVMTHVLVVGAIMHRVGRKRPRMRWTMIASSIAGWLFWSGVLLWVGHRRVGGWWPEWVHPGAWVLPLALAMGFVVLIWIKLGHTQDSRRAADRVARYGALWLPLYGAAWLLVQGAHSEAALMGGLALAGWLGMTVLREVYGLIEQPVGYRR